MGLEISDHEVDGGDYPLTKRLELGQKSLLELQHACLGHSSDFELVFGPLDLREPQPVLFSELCPVILMAEVQSSEGELER